MASAAPAARASRSYVVFVVCATAFLLRNFSSRRTADLLKRARSDNHNQGTYLPRSLPGEDDGHELPSGKPHAPPVRLRRVSPEFSDHRAACFCAPFNPGTWKQPAQRKAGVRRCFFIDLGANSGDTQLAFLGYKAVVPGSAWKKNAFGQPDNHFDFGKAGPIEIVRNDDKSAGYDTGAFGRADCYSYLFEPNPKFKKSLEGVAALFHREFYPAIRSTSRIAAADKPGPEKSRQPKINPKPLTAAYMCDRDDGMFDVQMFFPTWDEHAAGSSLDGQHSDVLRQKAVLGENHRALPKPVQVSYTNLARFLYETVMAQDHVIVKMDVEGAEWDILPCLAHNPEVLKLIDFLYVENHCWTGTLCCNDKKWHQSVNEKKKDNSTNRAYRDCYAGDDCVCHSKGQSGKRMDDWNFAVATLQKAGVKMPHYNTLS